MIGNLIYPGINLGGWIQGDAMKKKSFFKTTHWVGHFQLRYLDTDDLFKIAPVFNENQASVTGNTMKQSVPEKEKNIVLLQ